MRNLMTAGAISLFAALNCSVAMAQDVTADSVVATVNGTDITLGHVIVLRSQLPAEYQNLPADVLFDGIIKQIVEQTLLAEAASADGASEPMEVRLALENENRALMASVEIDRIVTQIPEDAVQALYEETYVNVEAEPEFNASHILVETEEEALALIETLNGGADFADLAKEKSTGPSGPNGGELGWFGKGMMVEPFELAVLQLEVGQFSPPVQTQFGWHVLILNELRDIPAPTLESVQDELLGQIQQSAVEAAIAALTDGAEITRMDAELDPALMGDMSLLAD